MSDKDQMSVAIVTGAGRGIGKGIASALAQAGYQVVLTDIDASLAVEAAVELATQGLAVVALPLDVTSAADWQRLMSAVGSFAGRLDVLVNNAGISPRGTVETTDQALWDRTMALNLKGPFLGIQAAMPLLKGSRGTIVNIGSTRATRPRSGLFAYGVSKAGLWGLTRQVAIDSLDDGVTCNMVAPGWVDTPGERILQQTHGRPDFPDGTRNLITPGEIGAAVVYLCSPAGRRVNGVTLYVDAGLHAADDAGMVYLSKDDSRGYT